MRETLRQTDETGRGNGKAIEQLHGQPASQPTGGGSAVLAAATSTIPHKIPHPRAGEKFQLTFINNQSHSLECSQSHRPLLGDSSQ
jgi:hypothetical protein